MVDATSDYLAQSGPKSALCRGSSLAKCPGFNLHCHSLLFDRFKEIQGSQLRSLLRTLVLLATFLEQRYRRGCLQVKSFISRFQMELMMMWMLMMMPFGLVGRSSWLSSVRLLGSDFHNVEVQGAHPILLLHRLNK